MTAVPLTSAGLSGSAGVRGDAVAQARDRPIWSRAEAECKAAIVSAKAAMPKAKETMRDILVMVPCNALSGGGAIIRPRLWASKTDARRAAVDSGRAALSRTDGQSHAPNFVRAAGRNGLPRPCVRPGLALSLPGQPFLHAAGMRRWASFAPCTRRSVSSGWSWWRRASHGTDKQRRARRGGDGRPRICAALRPSVRT